MNEPFRKFARACAEAAGRPWVFALAILVVALWALAGRFFGYSNTWQLVINTTTTVITFLMVFLIQNTQNRETKVIQIKLDELLNAVKRARETLIDLEEFSDAEIDALYREFREIAERERHKKHGTRSDQGTAGGG